MICYYFLLYVIARCKQGVGLLLYVWLVFQDATSGESHAWGIIIKHAKSFHLECHLQQDEQPHTRPSCPTTIGRFPSPTQLTSKSPDPLAPVMSASSLGESAGVRDCDGVDDDDEVDPFWPPESQPQPPASWIRRGGRIGPQEMVCPAE